MLGKKGEVQSYLTLVGLRSPNFAITVGNSGHCLGAECALQNRTACLLHSLVSVSQTLHSFHNPGEGNKFSAGKVTHLKD